MLQNIRDNIQGTVAKVIIAIVIVPFAIFGIESLIGNGGGPAEVARVNGDKITELELQQAIGIQKRQMLAMMGDNVQPELLEDSALRGPALDGLISQHLLQRGAADLKLGIPVPVVDQTIIAMPAFQENNQFSPERYQMLLRNQGYTPAYFKHLLQQELVVNQLHSGVVESDFVTQSELQQVAGLLQQQRSFHYLVIPLAGLADKVTVADADLQAYYQEHQDKFLREERVKLEYIELQAADYAAPVDAAAIKAEYEREMAGFSAATERHAAHILIETNDKRSDEQARELADSLAKKVGAGEDFAKLAAQYSDDMGSKGSGGDLGTSTGDAFPPAFEAELAKLKVGEVSAPVKTEAGYHVIKLIDQQTKERPTFEQRQAEIAQRLQQSEAQPALVKMVEKLRDLVFNSEGLSAPAQELKLKLHESDWLDRKTADTLLSNPKIIAAAFSQEVVKEGNNSEVIELSPDHYLVLRAKEYQAAVPRQFAEVSSDIAVVVRQQKAAEEAKRVAQELAQQLQSGEELEKQAAQRGYVAKTVAKATRNSGAATPEILRAAFSMPRAAKGEILPTTAVDLSSGDIALLQLQEVAEGAPDSLNPTQRAALLAQLRQSFGTAGFAATMENLRARAEIKRH